MRALVVVAHPNSGSFSHAVANYIGKGIEDAGPEHSFEFADLSAE